MKIKVATEVVVDVEGLDRMSYEEVDKIATQIGQSIQNGAMNFKEESPYFYITWITEDEPDFCEPLLKTS